MLSQTAKAILSIGAFLCLTAATGADWPHLRGPTYDGVSQETGLADTWPEQGPPLVWSRELGQGYSGLIVAEGKLFTQSQTIGGQYLVCLDPDTAGQSGNIATTGPGSRAAPIRGLMRRRRIIAARFSCTSPTGLVCCVDAGSGTQSGP